MKEKVKSWFDTPYRKYENIAKIGIIFLVSGVISLIFFAKSDIDLPTWGKITIILIPFIGMLLTAFTSIQGFRLMHKGEAYDEREKKYLGKASFYSIIITVILSIIVIYIIDYLEYELANRTLVMIPITILCVSASLFFWYFKIKGDVN